MALQRRINVYFSGKCALSQRGGEQFLGNHDADKQAFVFPARVMPGQAAFCRELALTIRKVGSRRFYEVLLDLLRAVIGHDNAWIIRYTAHSRQDVVHTVNVPVHIREFYLTQYHHADPFAQHWARHHQPGVYVLRQVLGPDSTVYGDVYAPRVRVSDEIGVFLPSAGRACIVLFLVLAEGRFSDQDRQEAEALFPILEALHRIHLARMFGEEKAVETAHRGSSHLHTDPLLILDRVGVPVFANAAWRQAACLSPDLNDCAALPDRPGLFPFDEKYHVQVACFDKDFSLAPGGRGIVLLSKPVQDTTPAEHASFPLPDIAMLTGRERSLLTLILQRRSTGEIAQSLGIAKGTVKNYKLRLYRKANVTSERALVALFSPLLDEPEEVVRTVTAASRSHKKAKKAD
ncbi:Transcriptional regulator, LuxR family [Granulibacter bethesdensis]|nr:Transcriptional regulator, LuxR family [Granulibacter bethesdensis]